MTIEQFVDTTTNSLENTDNSVVVNNEDIDSSTDVIVDSTETITDVTINTVEVAPIVALTVIEPVVETTTNTIVEASVEPVVTTEAVQTNDVEVLPEPMVCFKFYDNHHRRLSIFGQQRGNELLITVLTLSRKASPVTKQVKVIDPETKLQVLDADGQPVFEDKIKMVKDVFTRKEARRIYNEECATDTCSVAHSSL